MLIIVLIHFCLIIVKYDTIPKLLEVASKMINSLIIVKYDTIPKPPRLLQGPHTCLIIVKYDTIPKLWYLFKLKN